MIADKSCKAKYSRIIHKTIKSSGLASERTGAMELLRPEIPRCFITLSRPTKKCVSASRRIRLSSITRGKFPKDFFVSVSQGPQRNLPLPPVGHVSHMTHSASAANVSLSVARTFQSPVPSLCASPVASYHNLLPRFKCTLPPMSASKVSAKLSPRVQRLLGAGKQKQVQILLPSSGLPTSRALPPSSTEDSLCDGSLLGNSEFIPVPAEDRTCVEKPGHSKFRAIFAGSRRRLIGSRVSGQYCPAEFKISIPDPAVKGRSEQDKFTSYVTVAQPAPVPAGEDESPLKEASMGHNDVEELSQGAASSSTSCGSSQSLDRQIKCMLNGFNMRPASGRRTLAGRRLGRKEAGELESANNLTFGPQE